MLDTTQHSQDWSQMCRKGVCMGFVNVKSCRRCSNMAALNDVES